MDSVEGVCNTLARTKLLAPDEVRTLRTRWRDQAGARADEVKEFKRWLTETGQVTGFQLEMLTRGFADQLYFDDYKLLERIGQGRMAGVYKAVHASGQVVAIKVLPPSRANKPALLGRFLRESRLAVRFDHGNVVRTFHAGKTKDGMYYLVMECLEGETLEDVLKKRKRLSVEEAVPLMMQALAGLDHLDEKTVVHRDLKPGNLMLVPAPAEGMPVRGVTLKILDIGLSRSLFDEGSPDPAEVADLTREGALLGTMNYMAPEQARHAHAADIRADIYSLGCVFFEMLAGRPPFTETNIVKQMKLHAESAPPALATLVPGIPEDLDAVVQKMLAKDPALRYPTPGLALKDVRKLPVPKFEPPPPPRPSRSFLTWLDTKPVEEVDWVPAPGMPIPVPAVEAPRAAAAPPTAAPTPAGAAPVIGLGLGNQTVTKTAERNVQPITFTPSAPPEPAPPAEKATRAPGALPAQAQPVEMPGVVLREKLKPLLGKLGNVVRSLSTRDWICIGAGAGLMLVLQAVLRVLVRILG